MTAIEKLSALYSGEKTATSNGFDNRECRHLHHQIFNVEKLENGQWKPHGTIAVHPDGAFHDKQCLHNLSFHKATNSLMFSHGTGKSHKSGRLHFTDNGRAFVGTMLTSTGMPQTVRGTRGYDEIFDTKRRLNDKPSDPLVTWDTLEIKTDWVDHPQGAPELVVTYLLGGKDVSNRVRVTKVNRAKGTTVLEMVPSFLPGGDTDSFDITLAFGNKTFIGTYTASDGTVYAWQGSLQSQSHATLAKGLKAANDVAMPEIASFKPRMLATAVNDAVVKSTLSLQDLDNVSSIIEVTDKDNNQLTVDQAQTTAGKYYNQCLINGLDQKWIDSLFGHAFILPDGVNKVFNDNKTFFQNNSVMATGQMLYDNFATDPTHKSAIDKIQPKALKSAWTNLGNDKNTAGSYQAVTSDIYTQGFRYGVAGIQPYLADSSADWGKQYYDYLTDESNLLTWQIQIASKEFTNIKGRMYEWYTKLSVLSPGSDYPKQMLSTAYSALLGVAYNKVKWSEDIKPYLAEVISQAEGGSTDFLDQMQKQSVEETQKILRDMITTADTATDLVDAIASALTIKANKNPNASMAQLANEADFVQLVGQQLPQSAWKAWGDLSKKEKIGGVLGSVGYMAGAGFLLYSIASNADKPLTAKQIVEEVNMGIIAMGLLVKGMQKIMTLGVGRALETWAAAGQSGFRDFAANIAKWFSKDGKVVPEGAIGKAFTKIFGENYTEFFARRLGPVLAVFGVVLSSIFLADAIKSGDTRDIVFESLNTFFALADVVFIGLELLSFAWAGPVGLAVAAVGVVVMVVQLIWNLIDPPSPPADPIEQFVDGPMKEKGFAN